MAEEVAIRDVCFDSWDGTNDMGQTWAADLAQEEKGADDVRYRVPHYADFVRACGKFVPGLAA
jgi:hypothetical protein